MENMDKGLTEPNQPKIPQMPQKLSTQAQKLGILMKKAFIGVRSLCCKHCSPQLGENLFLIWIFIFMHLYLRARNNLKIWKKNIS